MLPLPTAGPEPKSDSAPARLNLPWTIAGLAVAIFAGPLVIGVFTAWQIPWTTTNVVLREILVFAFAGALAFIIRRGELLGWESVGLQRPNPGATTLWVLITIPCVALALALAILIIKVLGLPMGSSADAIKFDSLPRWVVLLVVVRAGFVEEFFYRGYAIDRLQRLTGSRAVAVMLPLVLFGLFHYRQGWAGIIIAFLVGAVLSAVYLYKRNLWIGIITHFLIDFIPNILLPLFATK